MDIKGSATAALLHSISYGSAAARAAELRDAGQESAAQLRLERDRTALLRLQESNSPKQRAKEKLALLLRRLQELKALLMNASPGEAKALASELKSLAGQLAGIAEAAGTAGQGAGAEGATASDAQGAVTTAESAGLAGAVEDSPAENEGAAETAHSAGENPPGTKSEADPQIRGASTKEGDRRLAGLAADPDQALKEMLAEARRLVQEIRHQLGAKLSQWQQAARHAQHGASVGMADSVSVASGQNVAAAYAGLNGSTASGAASAVLGQVLAVGSMFSIQA